MRAILILFAVSCLPAQILTPILQSDIPNAPVDSNSGGGCTGSSGAWTCTSTPTITLTDASASTILYTTNGSTPACPATGTLYTGAFSGLSSTFTLKAVGCNGLTGGGVLTSVYTISAAACTPAAGYSYCREVTINPTSLSLGSSPTSFPNFFTTTNSTFATATNGGHVQNTVSCCASSLTVPADFIFTTDSAGMTKCTGWDWKFYSATSGLIGVYFNCGTISSSASINVYISYGDSSVTTYQTTASNTWDSNFLAVYLFGTSSSLDLHDSTANSYTMTGTNTPTATSGAIGGGGSVNFVRSSSQSIGTSSSSPAVTGAYNVTAWVNPTNFGSTYNNIATGPGSQFDIGSAGKLAYYGPSDSIDPGTSVLSTSTWSLVAVDDSTAGTVFYINGGVDKSACQCIGTGSHSGMLYSGAYSGSGYYFNGAIDALFFSKVARGADWEKLLYNEQKSSQTIITLGSEL